MSVILGACRVTVLKSDIFFLRSPDFFESGSLSNPVNKRVPV